MSGSPFPKLSTKLNKKSMADPTCVWVPCLFSVFLDRLYGDELRGLSLRLERQPDLEECKALLGVVLRTVTANLMPAGNA